MQNFIQEGRTLYITAPAGGTVSGVPVVIGKIFTIASETVAGRRHDRSLAQGCVHPV